MILGNSLDKYYKMADSFPLLTPEREIELAISIIENSKGKQKAREELMTHNLKLVVKMALEYYNKENLNGMNHNNSELDVMDIISAGNIGLLRAVDLFNPVKFKTRFSTYATAWIKQGILSLLYSTNKPVYVPKHIIHTTKKYKTILEKDKHSTLSNKDMMKVLNVTEAGLDNIKNSGITSFSMDMKIKNSKGSVADDTYKDIIPDIKQENAYEQSAIKDSINILREAIDMLDPISKDIIIGQYLTPNKVKLSELGKKHKVSGEMVRQIKSKALKKMKWHLKRKTLTQI